MACSDNGWRPYVCVPELSKTAQTSLKIRFDGTNNTLLDQTGTIGQVTKLSQMAQVSVDGCIKLNPCCTSEIAFDSIQGLLGFLSVSDNLLSSDQRRIRNFMKGQYTC